MTMTTGTNAIEAVNKVPNERMEDLIHEALVARMDERDCEMKFQEFDVSVRREVGKPIFVDLNVSGMSGDTSKDSFAKIGPNGVEVVKGGGSFSVKLDDDSVVKFVFSEVLNLNSTDYLVTYRLA